MELNRNPCPCGCGKPLWIVLNGGIVNPHMLTAAARDAWAMALGRPAKRRW